MKHPLLFFLLIIVSSACMEKENSVSDIDGNRYLIKDYHGTLWMAENLKTRKDADGQPIPYFFPNDDSTKMQEYGLLYDYVTACKVCPEGWELPTNEDWNNLFFVDGDSSALEFKSAQLWDEPLNTNISQFSVKPAGYGNNGEFDNFFRSKTYFWSKTEHAEHIWTYIFEKGKNKIRKAEQHPTYAYSVRCIKRKKEVQNQ